MIEPNKRKLYKRFWFFLKFILSDRGGHCDDPPWTPMNAATPWCVVWDEPLSRKV